MRFLSLIALFASVLFFGGCGGNADSAKQSDTVAASVAEDTIPSPETTRSEVVSTGGAPALRYTDTQSGLAFEAPLLYSEVYENQITVIYTEPQDYPGLTYQDDLEGELKIGLYTSQAADAEEYAADLKKLSALPGVLVAEPNYRVKNDAVLTAATVNDEHYASQWGLSRIGIEKAWEVTTGSKAVVVAVIDTGVDYTHEDLAANIWTNPDEIAGNGVDDDHNGLVDDTKGFDFINRDSDPRDDHYHGTHCAGIIGAAADNLKGGAGVSPNLSLMPIKVLSSNGSGSTLGIFYGIRYAVEQKARIISMSLGGYGFNYLSYYGAYYAYANNVLVVAAAGNENNNNDRTPVYPAGFPFSNIIAVASVGTGDARSWFSNYGSTSVDIAAPGENILSTVPGNGYRQLSGTSMATPFVSGVAALVLATEEKLTSGTVRNYILSHARRVASLSGKVATGGILDANATLNDPALKKSLAVSAISPAADATGVAVNAKVTVTFTRLLDPASVTASTLLLTKNGTPVDANITVSGSRAVLTPAQPLEYGTLYRIEARRTLKADGGSGMEQDYTASFTTVAPALQDETTTGGDTDSALDGASGVSVYVTLRFAFDFDLTDAMIGDITCTLKDAEGNLIKGKLAYSHTDWVLTFTPVELLAYLSTYRVTLDIPSAGVAKAYSFTTGGA